MKERALGLGAKVATLPRLHEPAMTRIDARSTSFWAATQSGDKEHTGLGMLERQRVKVWLGRAYSELEKVGV